MLDFEIERVNLCQDQRLTERQLRLAAEINIASKSKVEFLNEVQSLGVIPMVRYVGNEAVKETTRFGKYFTLVSDTSTWKPVPIYTSDYRKDIDEAINDLIDFILHYLKSK